MQRYNSPNDDHFRTAAARSFDRQQARNNHLKWKLTAVGTLRAIGLGFTDYSAVTNASLVLCVIPLVCMYIDLHCAHLWLQIHTIGTYLSTEERDTYEQFAAEAERLGVLSAEKWLL